MNMRTNTAIDIRKALEDEIASGIQPPGTRLEEISLAQRFGVSRTPIREALRLLDSSGLVEVRPRRGAIVAAPTLDRLVDMFEVMAEMEAFCGRLAAKRMSVDERAELKAQHETCRLASESGQTDDYYEANARYHEVIYAGAHNAFLMEEVQQLRRRLRAYRRLQLRARDRLTDSFAEHTAITDALLNGDADVAGRLLHAHVSIQGDRFGEWLKTLNDARMISEPAE